MGSIINGIVSIVVTIGRPTVRVFLRILELTENISATLEHAQQELRACDKSLQQCRYDNKRWKNSRRQCETRVTNCEIQFDDLKRECADRYASYESQLTQKSEVIKQLKRTVVRCSKQNEHLTELYQGVVAKIHDMGIISELNCDYRLFTDRKVFERKINELNKILGQLMQELSECKDARKSSWFSSVADLFLFTGFTHKANQKA